MRHTRQTIDRAEEILSTADGQAKPDCARSHHSSHSQFEFATPPPVSTLFSLGPPTMANGLDKLERLFSTRKRAASSRNTAEPSMYGSTLDHAQAQAQARAKAHAYNLSTSSSPSEWQFQPRPESPPCFPQTPFIRPRANANAMQPRNELSISSPQSARTDSSSLHSRRLSSTFSLDSSNKDTMSDRQRKSSCSTAASCQVPSRTSSLLSRRHEKLPGGLIQLHLPGEKTTSAEDFPDASAFPLNKESAKAAPNALLDALPIYASSRLETPPPSDQDELHFPSPPGHGRYPSTTSIQLTPEPSPEMIPRRDSVISEAKSTTSRDSGKRPSLRGRRITTSSLPLLEDDWRDSYVPKPQENISPMTTVVVHEPAMEDFLTLTDEDIAEIKIEHPSKPPARRAPPPPVLPPSARSRALTSPAKRSPTCASPALASNEVAAWEAARIAKKYDFDVVYVANFWPDHMMRNLRKKPRKSKGKAVTSVSAPTSAVTSAHSSFSRSFAASSISSPASERFANVLTYTNSTTNSGASTPRSSLQSPPSSPLRREIGRAAPPSDLFASATRTTLPGLNTKDCRSASGSSCPPTTTSSTIRGSLLAGYGLETVAAPFRLNPRVHEKILRTEGWIEHRKSDATENEFARGYARAFHTGCSSSSPLPPSLSSVSLRSASSASAPWKAMATDVTSASDDTGVALPASDEKKENNSDEIDRGVVFVAYRRPRGPGGTVHSSAAELDALGRDAETLVELILDFHNERRRWESLQEAQAPTARRASE